MVKAIFTTKVLILKFNELMISEVLSYSENTQNTGEGFLKLLSYGDEILRILENTS